MIVSKDQVRQAVARAMRLHPALDDAIAAVAQALGLPVEAAREALEQEQEA